MEVGDSVYYYVNRSNIRKLGSVSYDRIMGKIIKIYNPEKRLTAVEIEELFKISPGDPKFRKFYIQNSKTLRVVIKTRDEECILLHENLWKRNTMGDEEYVVKVPNSIAFLFSDDY